MQNRRVHRFRSQVVVTVVVSLLAALTASTAGADSNPATVGIAAVCSVAKATTPATLSHGGVPAVVPGERVTFRESVRLEAGVVFQNAVRLADGTVKASSFLEMTQFPSSVVSDAGSIKATLGGVDLAPVAGTGPLPGEWALETDSSTAGRTVWRLYLPGDVPALLDAAGDGAPSVTIPTGGQELELSYDAVVPNAGYVSGELVDGAGCYAAFATGGSHRETDRTRSQVAIVDPRVDMMKTVVGLPVAAAGAFATYRFAANVPPVDPATDVPVAGAYGVRVTDLVPAELTPVDSDGTPVADGASVPLSGTPARTAMWDATARTLTTDLGDIARDATLTYEYRVRVASAVAPGTALTNTVGAKFSSLPGTVPEEREYDSPTAAAVLSIAAAAPAITKTSNVVKYVPGQPITYTLTATLPAGSAYSNLTVLDTLPDGITFGAYGTATCAGSAVCPVTMPSLTTTTVSSGQTTIGWYPNNIAASPTPITLTFTYTAAISAAYRSGTAVKLLDEFTNRVRLMWNNIDRLGAVSPSTAATPEFDGTVRAERTVTNDHPTVLIDKMGRPSGGGVANTGTYNWNYVPGQTVDYEVVLRNTGSQPASNLTLRDAHTGLTIDPATMTVDGAPCAACSVTSDAGSVTIGLPGPLAVGGTMTVRYTGTPTGTSLVNTATVTRYEDPDGTPYTEGPNDTVRIVIPDPALSIAKTLLGGEPAAGSLNGTLIPFRLTVTNTSGINANSVTVTDTAPSGTCATTVVRNPSAAVTSTAAGVFNLAAPLAPGASVTFETDLTICGTIAFGIATNTARVNWSDLQDDRNSSGAVYQASASASFNVRQPQLKVTKSPEAADGATVHVDPIPADTQYFTGEWRIDVKNTGELTAYNIAVNDPMPASLEYEPGTATVQWLSGTPRTMTDNSTADASGVVFAGLTRTFNATIDRLEPGQTARITVPFRQNGDTPTDLKRVNTATVSNANLPVGTAGLSDDGAYFLLPAEPTPTLSKTVSFGAAGASPGAEVAVAGVGGEVRYTVDVELPDDPLSTPLGLADVVMRDLLPDGMELTNEPAAGATLPSSGPWSVTCVSGPCASAEFPGRYVGSRPYSVRPGMTELFFYFGEFAAGADAVYRVTFTAKSKRAFEDGTAVADGVRDPLVNQANVQWNRMAARGAGASGDVISGMATLAGLPARFDVTGRPDQANVDLVSPRLDPRKDMFADAGRTIARKEFEPGDTIYYRVAVANSGIGDAYNVVFADNLGDADGINRMVIDPSSVNVVSPSPAGTTCSVVAGTPDSLRCELIGATGLAADLDGPIGPLPGGQIIVEYAATPLPSAELRTPLSFDPWEPDVIRNVVAAVDYTEVPFPGPLDNHFTAGQSVTRAYIHTPVPFVSTGWVVNAASFCPSSVGGGRSATVQLDVGNGAKATGGNPPLTPDLQEWPDEDIDGDGRIDKGSLYSPVVRLTLPATVSFAAGTGAVTATGPEAATPSANYSTFSPFGDPTTVVTNTDGTTTLTWELPAQLNPAPSKGQHQPRLRLRVGVTTVTQGSSTLLADIAGNDGSGASRRGDAVGELFNYGDNASGYCAPPGGGGGGGAPADHSIAKKPDQADAVTVAPGAPATFTVSISQGRSAALTGVSLIDDLPAGLTYAGALGPSDPNYSVATISPLPAGWASLEDYYTNSIPLPGGSHRIEWNEAMPDLPRGTYTVTIPVIADVPALRPNEFITNRATLNATQGNRSDSGAIKTVATAQPAITKRVDKPSIPFSAESDPQYFTFTSDLTIPAAFSAFDMMVRDFPNYSGGGFPLGGYSRDDVPAVKVEPGATVTCIAGCTDAVDTPASARLGDGPLYPYTGTSSGPLYGFPGNGGNINYNYYENGMTGWYLGDITPDPQGQDRVIRFSYRVKAPTVDELYAQIAGRHYSGNVSTITSRNDLTKLASQIEYNNKIQAFWQGTNQAWTPDFGSPWSEDWTTGPNPWSARPTNSDGGSIVAFAKARVEYPIVEIEKRCGTVDDPLARDVPLTAVGVDNTQCKITVRNISGVTAFDATVSDQPGAPDAFYSGYTAQDGRTYAHPYGTHATSFAPASGTRTYNGTVGQPTYLLGAAALTTAAPPLSAAVWQFDLQPGESRDLTYKLRLDGFTNQPAESFDRNNAASYVGVWDNQARLDTFSATRGGAAVLPTQPTAVSQATFTKPFVSISKFPAQPSRTADSDLRPFNENNTQWAPWNGGYGAIYRNVFGGGWYNQATTDDYVTGDILTPYTLRRASLDDVWNERGPLFMRHQSDVGQCLGWNHCTYRLAGAPSNANTWNFNLDDPDQWSPNLYANPDETYRWGVDVRVDGLKNLDNIVIEDRLPFGWTYVPGSARLVEAKWNVGNQENAANPTHDPSVVDSLARVATFDPAVNSATQGASCTVGAYGNNGPTLTWTFDKNQAAKRGAWDHLYLDAGDLHRQAQRTRPFTGRDGFNLADNPEWNQFETSGGFFDRFNWLRLEFDAVPTVAALGCDPNTTTDARPFMQENNTTARISNTLDPAFSSNRTFKMLAPVVNPVALSKTPDNGYTGDDATVPFTVTFQNKLDVPVEDLPIRDVLVLNGIDPTLTPDSRYVCGTATSDGPTFTETSCARTATTASSATWTVDWVVDRLEPGQSITFTMSVRVALSERNLATLNNTASTTVKEWYDRTLTEVGKYTVVNASPPPTPAKSVTPNPATINDTVTYTVTWVQGSTQAYNDLIYADVMPDGLELVSMGAVACTGGCPKAASAVTTMTPEPQADGTTRLGWWFGDMNGSVSASTWRMTYTAKVKGQYANGSRVTTPVSVVNTVRGASNKINTLGAAPPVAIPTAFGTWFFPGTPATATLRLREPQIVVSKTAVAATNPARSGDTITYTVTARNTGELPAYAVNVVDTPDPRSLEDIAMNAPVMPSQAPTGSAIVNGWTLLDPQIGWYVPRINPNGTATFSYTAKVTAGYLAAGVSEATNDADVTSFRGRDGGLDAAPGDRLYTDVLNATTVTPLGAPKVEVEKFVAGCTLDSAYATRGTPERWCIRVRNVGVVTATGVTLADTLPSGWTYDPGSVTGTGWTAVEPAISSAGQRLDWTLGDLDPDESVTVEFTATADTLAPVEGRNSATAVAALGDGTPAPPGTPGYRATDTADVALQPFGLEIAKSAKSQTRPSTIGAASWTLTATNPGHAPLNNVIVTDNLPAALTYDTSSSTAPGWSVVSVGAPGSGPGGTNPVTWRIDILAPGASAETLVDTIVPTDVDVDTWFQNEVSAVSDETPDPVVSTARIRFFTPASIGDRVWDDLDADGRQESGEPGVGAVVVRLLDENGDQVYQDPATGAVTTDASLGFPAVTVTTDADGRYLLDGLRPGAYRVGVDLPVDRAFTFQTVGVDEDDDSNVNRRTGRTAPVTVVAGDAATNVDAGLIAAANSIGDVVWYDADGDGIQDPTAAEAGLAGVTVRLFSPGPDGEIGGGDDLQLDSIATDGSGTYLFANLPDGAYYVTFALDPDAPFHESLVPVFPGQGSDPAADSDIVARSANRTGLIELDVAGTSDDSVVDSTIDAGFAPKASLGNRVWHDIDGDRLQGPGEPGLEGVTVELLNTAGEVLATVQTAADGGYSFDDIPLGDFAVRFGRPAGFDATSPGSGSDRGLDSDADPATLTTAVVTLTAGEYNDRVDAGFYQPVCVGGPLWIDLDRDGIIDSGEPPIVGHVVELLDSDGDPVLDADGNPITTTTDADGRFVFEGLAPGRYQTRVTAPDGYTITLTEQGGDPALDSNGLTATSDVLESGDSDLTLGAGFTPNYAHLGDRVWDDLNGDGIQDAGESGVEGVSVRVTGTDIYGQPVDRTVAAGPDGTWNMDLYAGDYTVTYTLSDGTAVSPTGAGGDTGNDSNGPVSTVTLAADETNHAVDLGIYTPVSVGGPIWVDMDGDGIRAAGEPALVGWRVELLDRSGNPVLDGAGDPITALSGPDGAFVFDGLPPGRYRTRTTTPAGHVLTLTGQGADPAVDSNGLEATSAELASGDADLTLGVGFIPISGGLGDRVWNDFNGNEVQDAGEPGVEGVTVNLTGTDIYGNPVDKTVVTDDNGNWSVELVAGDYTVTYELLPTTLATVTGAGDDPNADSDGLVSSVTLAAGESNRSVDLGLVYQQRIGDRLFLDIDGNGIQDRLEPGISGVLVTLYDADGAILRTTTTDADGGYLFDSVPTGTYSVGFATDHRGWSFSPAGSGSDRGLDSNADSTGRTPEFELGAEESQVTIDAGVVPTPATVSSVVWYDTNRDGLLSPGEAPVAGVVVVITGVDDWGIERRYTVTTDANGRWTQTLPPGTYDVEWIVPGGYGFTTPGGDSSPDLRGHFRLKVMAGEVVRALDAGLVPAAPPSSGEKAEPATPPTLAFTGSGLLRFLAIAFVPMSFGAMLLVQQRRRRRRIGR